MLKGPVLKYRPDDFLVRENMVVALGQRDELGQQYLVLRKRGYTTMEAVRLVAERIGVASTDITYGGLKDEDGITEQLIAVPVAAAEHVGGYQTVVEDTDRWLRLQHYGYGGERLRIGQLEGNGFRIVVRNLDAAEAQRLGERRKVNLFFFNYYDTQRFGVPGGPKRTHLVGAAILAGDWDRALQELIELRAPESELAGLWSGSAEMFFRDLDPRTASFYLAAHASSAWNAQLRAAIDHSCPGDWSAVHLEGLEYRYVSKADLAVRLLAHTRELPYARYTLDDGRAKAHTSMRPTVVQTTVSLSCHKPDELIAGKFSVGLNFFLPSGCYATAAVRQLLAYR